MADRLRWRPILFVCPQTGEKVQGLVAEKTDDTHDHHYEAVTCLACSGMHFVDSTSGEVLGAKRSPAGQTGPIES